MPRFIRDIALFTLVQVLLIAALVGLFYDVRDVSPLSPATVIKHKRLADAPSPRMIFIGGSNLLFGLDSKMFEQQTSYHPVNMGLIGGLRLDYIINEIEATLRAGDIVVMSIEYNTLNVDESAEESQVIMGVAAQRLENFRYLSWPQWKRLLDRGAMEYLGVVFRQAFTSITPRRDELDPLINQDMNVYGDLTRYHDPAVKPRKPNNQNTLIKIKPDAVLANIAKINAFVARCRDRDVQVMYAYPPIPRTHFRQNEAVARRFHRMLRQDLLAPILVSPEDMTFEDSSFIGLSYHLRGTAVQQRTQMLIDAINRRLRRAANRATTSPTDAGEAN